MGGMVSGFFQSGGHLLCAGASPETQAAVLALLQDMRDRERSHIEWGAIEAYIHTIPKGENILSVQSSDGYNLLQRAIGFNCVELVKWILSRGCDVNRGACSLPLHIAALHGTEEIVELLLKHGARVDLEARMCFPGPHNNNCELRFNNMGQPEKTSDRLQSAEYYAIDGDQSEILELLLAQGEDNWLPWQQKRPLLHLACERGAWNCVRYLVSERSDEINQCYDEYYPIHQAAIQDLRFLGLLIQCGADILVRTSTQQMSVLHVVLLSGRKSAEDTMGTIKMLLEHGCRELINAADTLGNTPMHALIVRYALEESRYGYNQEPRPWTKWDMLHMLRYLMHSGAIPSINHTGNSALACVLRHIRDWEFRYELLEMLLASGGDPNCVGRDGSVPLMVCLVPLINKDPLQYLTHNTKVFYLNSVRLLCKNGANPNCFSRSNLTPLHVLVYTASEYISLNREEEKCAAFAFIRQLLVILLQHGLDPNVEFSIRTPHILLALMDLVQNARQTNDFDHVHALTVVLLQYGADPNTPPSSHPGAHAEQQQPVLCHSQSSLFIKKPPHWVLYHYVQLIVRKEELLVDEEETFTRLIWLYYFAMEHGQIFQCLRALATQTAALTPTARPVATLLRHLRARPRSLKQIARVAIHAAMQPRIPTGQPNATRLPLPQLLKDYLLDWRP